MVLPRLIFITGKGGTGKSTIAAALALALSHHRETAVADLDRRLSVARMLGVSLHDSKPVRAARNLDLFSLTAHAELEAFIERIVPIKTVSRRMLQSRTFGYVTAALPGLEAFLMLERLRALAGEAALSNGYVVIDGPATGTALELLSVAHGVKGIAPFGTLNRLAGEAESFLRDRHRFGVVLTLTPDELALREAVAAVETLRDKLRIEPRAAILNGVADALFDSEELDAAAALGNHGQLAARRLDAARLAARARDELTAARVRIVDLPMLFEPVIGEPQLRELSARLDAELIRQ
jgi:anion-transporting  ArsA/GET3 family ATPase